MKRKKNFLSFHKMIGRSISALNIYDPEEVYERIRDARRSNLKKKLKEISPFPSFVEITVGDSFSKGGFYSSPRNHILFNVLEGFRNLQIYSKEETKTTIETRPNSTYQFKKSSTSTWEMYRDGTHCDGDANSKFDDDDYVTETYYAIIDAKDIPKFIKDSGEMINGEDRIDPLGDGKFHETQIYIISEKEVLPIGLWELIERKKEHRNMTLNLVLDKENARNFIKEFKSMKPFLRGF